MGRGEYGAREARTITHISTLRMPRLGSASCSLANADLCDGSAKIPRRGGTREGSGPPYLLARMDESNGLKSGRMPAARGADSPTPQADEVAHTWRPHWRVFEPTPPASGHMKDAGVEYPPTSSLGLLLLSRWTAKGGAHSGREGFRTTASLTDPQR